MLLFFFVFLVMFNVQIGMNDGESSDISLLGLSISVFVPNAVASGSSCYATYIISLFHRVHYCGTCSTKWGKGEGRLGSCEMLSKLPLYVNANIRG